MPSYSTLAGLLLSTGTDLTTASACHVCVYNDSFLSILKSTCHLNIQTSSQCCQYYKNYAERCGQSCSLEVSELNTRIQSTFNQLYDKASYQVNVDPSHAGPVVLEYLLFAQNIGNHFDTQKAERLEHSLNIPVMTCASCKSSDHILQSDERKCHSPIQTSDRCVKYYHTFMNTCSISCSTEVNQLQQNAGFTLRDMHATAGSQLKTKPKSALDSIVKYQKMAEAVRDVDHMKHAKHFMTQYNKSIGKEEFMVCSECIAEEGYLNEKYDTCHSTIIATVECSVYYTTFENVCQSTCPAEYEQIQEGIEKKLNNLFSEATTKFRLFGRDDVTLVSIEEYITFAQGVDSKTHIAKGKALRKDFNRGWFGRVTKNFGF